MPKVTRFHCHMCKENMESKLMPEILSSTGNIAILVSNARAVVRMVCETHEIEMREVGFPVEIDPTELPPVRKAELFSEVRRLPS